MKHIQGFMDFVREQGVIGLAVGFILGGAVSKVVSSLVEHVINPLIGLLLGSATNLSSYVVKINGADVHWGMFITTLVDFVIIALVVYFGVKLFKFDKLDKKD